MLKYLVVFERCEEVHEVFERYVRYSRGVEKIWECSGGM